LSSSALLILLNVLGRVRPHVVLDNLSNVFFDGVVFSHRHNSASLCVGTTAALACSERGPIAVELRPNNTRSHVEHTASRARTARRLVFRGAGTCSAACALKICCWDTRIQPTSRFLVFSPSTRFLVFCVFLPRGLVAVWSIPLCPYPKVLLLQSQFFCSLRFWKLPCVVKILYGVWVYKMIRPIPLYLSFGVYPCHKIAGKLHCLPFSFFLFALANRMFPGPFRGKLAINTSKAVPSFHIAAVLVVWSL